MLWLGIGGTLARNRRGITFLDSIFKYPHHDSMAKSKTIAQRTTATSLIKPAEMIDIEESVPLHLVDRRILNLLLANAWDHIDQDVEHCIRKRDLRGTTKDFKRLDETIGRLQAARIKLLIKRDDNKKYRRSFGLLQRVDEGVAQNGLLYYKFDPDLRAVISESTVFARLQKDILLQLSSKYSLCLYELIQRRVNLTHKWSEDFTIEEIRKLLTVPKGKLALYKNLNGYALKPAVAEVNGLADFGVQMKEIKKGRKVTGITLAWHRKNQDQLKEAYEERSRHRVGRRARLSGKVETPVSAK